MATRRLKWTLTGEDLESLRSGAPNARSSPPRARSSPPRPRSVPPKSRSLPPVGSVRSLGVEDIGVAFQPIVDLSGGQLFAVEALARPRRLEFPNPGVLFDAAVRESATGRLGRTIREVTFSSCPSIPVFVNIHPSELTSRWLVRPDDPLSFHDSAVYLEVTEAAAFEYFDLCMNVLKEVCTRTGSFLVIDDLGAGHSNLKRVLDLEPRIVKLDIALVAGIDKSRRQQILVRHLVELFAELGAKVVGEGIETLDELKALRDTGTQFGQGYLLARPANPVPAVTWPLGPARPQPPPLRRPR